MSIDIIRKLILKDNPDYDFERQRFTEGDIVTSTLDSSLLLVIQSGVTHVEAIVIRRGFQTEKGVRTRVPYDNLPYYSIGEYKRPPWVFQKKLKYEAGDIVRIDDEIYCVLKRDNEYLTCLALESHKECGIYLGASYSIPDPYWGYHQTITD